MDPAFSYRGLRLFTEDSTTRGEHKMPAINQFAAEMDHFALCLKNDTQPRTPGNEGLLDLRAMVAINQAIATSRTVEM